MPVDKMGDALRPDPVQIARQKPKIRQPADDSRVENPNRQNRLSEQKGRNSNSLNTYDSLKVRTPSGNEESLPFTGTVAKTSQEQSRERDSSELEKIDTSRQVQRVADRSQTRRSQTARPDSATRSAEEAARAERPGSPPSATPASSAEQARKASEASQTNASRNLDLFA